MSDLLDKEMTDLIDWAWGDGLAAIDAKDAECKEASAHIEMFLVLGDVLSMLGWTRNDLIQILDECVFSDQPTSMVH